MVAFRSIAVDAPEGTLPGTVRPTGFAPTGPRPGKAAASDYFVVFHDTNGAAMIGGSATLAWYGVSFDGAVLMTASIGAAVVTADHIMRKIEVGEGVYPWPRVTAMTPPAVASKSIRVNVGASADGLYSIQVDATTAVTFAASGDDEEAIRDGLLAAFAAHPTASAEADAEVDDLLVTYDTAGQDFELTLVSPGDALTQEEVAPVLPVAATLRIYIAASTPSGVDAASIAAGVAAELTIPTVAEIVTGVGAQAACAAALTAAAGVAIPSIAQNQAGLATTAALSTLQTTCSALPSAAAVATAVGAQAACSAAIAASFGNVQYLPLMYVSEVAGAAEVLPAPGAGFRLEILGWTTYNFNSTMFVTFRSNGVDLDANPRMMLTGVPLHEAAVSPLEPLYVLAENEDFSLTMDVSQEYLISVHYRTVAV